MEFLLLFVKLFPAIKGLFILCDLSTEFVLLLFLDNLLKQL